MYFRPIPVELLTDTFGCLSFVTVRFWEILRLWLADIISFEKYEFAKNSIIRFNGNYNELGSGQIQFNDTAGTTTITESGIISDRGTEDFNIVTGFSNKLCYNGNEIATKQDIENAITTALNTAV